MRPPPLAGAVREGRCQKTSPGSVSPGLSGLEGFSRGAPVWGSPAWRGFPRGRQSGLPGLKGAPWKGYGEGTVRAERMWRARRSGRGGAVHEKDTSGLRDHLCS